MQWLFAPPAAGVSRLIHTIPTGNVFGQYLWVIIFVAGTKKPPEGGLVLNFAKAN
ncbi:hypothetical protein ACQZN4_002028 [Vibrio alginolyticus]